MLLDWNSAGYQGLEKDETLHHWLTRNYSSLSNPELREALSKMTGVAVTENMIANRAKRLGLRKTSDTVARAYKQRGAIKFDAIPEDDRTNEDYYLELERRARWESRIVSGRYIQIDDDRPIGIVATGDWHIGNKGVDYAALRSAIDAVSAADGVYVVGTGDYYDNYKAGNGRMATGIYESVVPLPGSQEKSAEYLLEKLRGKILALVSGCHIDWSYQSGGETALERLCKSTDTISLGHGGMLHVEFGGVEYEIGVRHRYGGASMKAFYDFTDKYPLGSDPDVVILGHFHINLIAQERRRGKIRTYVRSGGWKVDDDYGQKLAGYSGEPGMPLVILYPHSKSVHPWHGESLEDGLEYLRLLRERWGGPTKSSPERGYVTGTFAKDSRDV